MAEDDEEVGQLDLLDLLARPIAFHACLARLAGSTAAGLFLSQALYWQARVPADRGGWWWHTQIEWAEETCLSRWEQESARKVLRDLGVIEEAKKGLPQRLWFRVNLRQLAVLLKKNKKINRVLENHMLVCGKTAGKNVTKPQASPRQNRRH